MNSDFETFISLPDDLQLEALREGALLLDAQLRVATAADSRALAWGGLLVGAVTGSLGGGIALLVRQEPDFILAFLALSFAGLMGLASHQALSTVRPKLFCLPGNEPGNWLPAEWDCTGTEKRKIKRARIDQARQMTSCIRDNRQSAKDSARAMHKSFRTTQIAILVGGLGLTGIWVSRAFSLDGMLAFLSFCG